MKQVLIVRKDLNMRKGKIAAQCAHAAVDMTMKLKQTGDFFEWYTNGQTKICVSVNSEEELLAVYTRAKDNDVPATIIIDSGRTEFHGVPTKTVVAIGPAEDSRIDAITGHLPLL